MEEFVGDLWHRMVTWKAETDYPDARVELAQLTPQLAPFFRAMGGSPGKVLEASQPRAFNTRRRFVQRIAGTHRRFSVSWQDERSVRLPPSLAVFPEPDLNEALYFWLTALAAKQPYIQHWFIDNQRACSELLKEKAGLAKSYNRLVSAVIDQRVPLTELTGVERVREVAVRQALRTPGSVQHLPRASGDLLPIPLWLYPSPLRVISVDSDDQLDDFESSSAAAAHIDSSRKEAKRVDDSKETDGLLVFQLESLFSWTEQVELDRCQDEDQEDNLASAVEDLDIISLSRQRRAGAAKIKFDLDLPAAHNDELPVGNGIRLPEWDYRKSQLVKDFCLLQPMLADEAVPAVIPERLNNTARYLKNRFARLKLLRQWQYRQPFGEELDLDAWLDNVTNPVRSQENPACFKSRAVNSRDLSCLLLADLSMSTDSALNADQRVIDVIRDTLLLFAEALNSSGDQFAIYGFSSVKNKQVRYNLLKNFSETYSDHARGRIVAIKPGFYTRMGAAIRQSTEILKQQKSQQRLLLIVSDGKPNDIDHYEGRYGIEDTRQAILEAKREGLQPFCVTIDDKGNDYLPYLFGSQGYALVSDVTRLPTLLPKLYLNLVGINN
ncbi:MAG TPA: VWA domain-containing protein [Porticoccus sp.]|nr:VWA domain-containing protein [Porticoccus sp.]